MASTGTNSRRISALRQWLLIGLFAFATSAHGADVLTNSIPKLKPVPPCPALIMAAQARHIPIGQIDPPYGTNTLRPGDSATVLVTFVHKGDRIQWLLYVEATMPDPKKKPEKSWVTVSPDSGKPVKFESELAPAKLRLLGPFAMTNVSTPGKPHEKDARVLLDKSFLGLGLDKAAALVELRWNQMTNSKSSQSAFKLTSAEQRIFYGQFPALYSYIHLVSQTKGLNDLFFKLVELPSIWSMIRHGGMRFNLSDNDPPARANPVNWNLPASADVYYYPWLLQLNGQPALKITLVVTRPHPPLLICSGVVGILAEKAGDNGTYMTLRVVNAHEVKLNGPHSHYAARPGK